MKTRKQTDRRYHIRRVASGAVPVRKHQMHYWGVTAKPLVHPNRIAVVSKPFENKADARKFLKHLEAENKTSKIGVIWGEPKIVKLNTKDSDGDGVPNIVDCDPLDPTKQDAQMSDIQKTIAEQIGWRELRMAGFNLSRDKDNIIGVNKGKRGIRIEYDEGKDTYTVTKIKIKPNLDIEEEKLDDVYWEDLRGIIQGHFPRFEYVMEGLRVR